MKLDETEVAIARALLPLMEKVGPAIRHAANLPQDHAGSIIMGLGASAGGNGIAVGRRVCAQPGMICVDVAWLRELVAEADHQEAKPDDFDLLGDFPGLRG